MMKLFYLAIVVLFGFNACEELDDEVPTITLKGDTQITLKLDTFIEEPGFSADDPQDGDLSKDVNITSNIDYSRVGEYSINYFVSDKDANRVTVKRVIKITQDGPNSGNYINYKKDASLYYLPSYLYDYQTLISGTDISHNSYAYDLNGNRVEDEDRRVSYKKDDGVIYKEISGGKTMHDFITLDEIKTYNSDDKLVSKYPVKLKVDNDYIDDDMSCHIVKRVDNFTTDSATNHLADGKNYFYEQVLKIQCNKNGTKTDIYYAKGKGEILRVTDERIIVVESTL